MKSRPFGSELSSRTVVAFSRLVGVQQPCQPTRLVGPGRRVGPVGTRRTQEQPVLIKGC
jgi:hypothetical protein